MVQAITVAIARNKGSKRLVAVLLAMIGVITTHEGTLPGYTAPVFETFNNVRTLVAPGYWEPWPTLVVIALGVAGVMLTTWSSWKSNGVPAPPPS